MAGSVALVYHGPMQKWEDILYRDEPMEATDWLVDAVVAVGAFGFACLQLTLSVNLLFPDEMLRSLLGIDAVVPTVYSVVAIALTTLPLIARRRFPWPTFVLSLVLWAFKRAPFPCRLPGRSWHCSRSPTNCRAPMRLQVRLQPFSFS